MQSVLILNATYQPLSTVAPKRAEQLIRQGKATPLDASGRLLHSAYGAFEIPYVILLTSPVKVNQNRKPAAFSRRGVLIRDNHVCAYCGGHATTIDHVHPQSLGGISSYENCVAACLKCNGKKASKTLDQLGWATPRALTMKSGVKAPSHMSKLLDRAKKDESAYKVWKHYIQMFEPTLA